MFLKQKNVIFETINSLFKHIIDPISVVSGC